MGWRVGYGPVDGEGDRPGAARVELALDSEPPGGLLTVLFDPPPRVTALPVEPVKRGGMAVGGGLLTAGDALLDGGGLLELLAESTAKPAGLGRLRAQGLCGRQRLLGCSRQPRPEPPVVRYELPCPGTCCTWTSRSSTASRSPATP